MITKPEGGGSYTRDPATGELTLVERTLHPSEVADEPAAEGDPAAEPAPTPSRRAKKEA